MQSGSLFSCFAGSAHLEVSLLHNLTLWEHDFLPLKTSKGNCTHQIDHLTSGPAFPASRAIRSYDFTGDAGQQRDGLPERPGTLHVLRETGLAYYDPASEQEAFGEPEVVVRRRSGPGRRWRRQIRRRENAPGEAHQLRGGCR